MGRRKMLQPDDKPVKDIPAAETDTSGAATEQDHSPDPTSTNHEAGMMDLKGNMITAGNEMCKAILEGRASDVPGTTNAIINIYNAVK